jgi:oligopeptide/dipeptide ABC transporter ATP-binding protein
MYAGQIVEEGPVEQVFARPRMPYTQALMRSRPRLGARTRIAAIPGSVPNLTALPPGCSFHPRCPHVVPGRCDTAEPPLEEAEPGWKVRCVRWRELDEAGR